MKRSRVLSICLCVLVGFTPPLTADEPGPADVVARLQHAIVQLMKSRENAAAETLLAETTQLIQDTHDLPFILSLIMGRHWRVLDDAQRQELLEKFTELSVTTYLSRFQGYSDERFELLEDRQITTGQWMVKTKLVTGNGSEINFDYHLRQTADGWHIINIIANNVSDLALKRAEYSKLLRESGYAGLVAALDKQILDNKGKI